MQQKGQISRERLPDVIQGIASVGSERDEKAEHDWGKTHSLRMHFRETQAKNLTILTKVALGSVFAHADAKCETKMTLKSHQKRDP